MAQVPTGTNRPGTGLQLVSGPPSVAHGESFVLRTPPSTSNQSLVARSVAQVGPVDAAKGTITIPLPGAYENEPTSVYPVRCRRSEVRLFWTEFFRQDGIHGQCRTNR